MTKKKESVNIDEILKRVLMVTTIITLVTISYKVYEFRPEDSFYHNVELTEQSTMSSLKEYELQKEVPITESGEGVVGYQQSMFEKREGRMFYKNVYYKERMIDGKMTSIKKWSTYIN